MAHAHELERLEGFVSRLLAGYKALREENEKLIEKLAGRDEVIGQLQQDLATIDRERSEVSGRISGLVVRIEQWEVELKAMGPALSDSDSDSSAVQASLFDTEQGGSGVGE